MSYANELDYPQYWRYELECYAGVYADDYDLDAIEREATAYCPDRHCRVWVVDELGLAELFRKYYDAPEPPFAPGQATCVLFGGPLVCTTVTPRLKDKPLFVAGC